VVIHSTWAKPKVIPFGGDSTEAGVRTGFQMAQVLDKKGENVVFHRKACPYLATTSLK
jgi:hypothetical protein